MYQLETRHYWTEPNIPIQFEMRNPQPPFPIHIHDFYEMVLVYSGKATHITLNGDMEIQGGDFISIKLGQAHGYKNIRNLTLMNVLIKPSFFEDDSFGLASLPAYEAMFGQDAGTKNSPVVYCRLDYYPFSKAKELIESANSELVNHADGYGVMVISLIQELIVLLLRNYNGRECSRTGFAADITALIGYVRNNYHSSLTMEDLLSISGMSESHILRIFKQYTGCSPFQYISRLRLKEAEGELIQSGKSITNIALDLGYNDSNYFTRLFRKYSGLSPREFRNKYLKENLL